MAHANYLALRGARDVKLHYTGEVLAKVKDQLVAHARGGHGLHGRVQAHRVAARGRELRRNAQGLLRHRVPRAVAKAHTGVKNLAVVELGKAHGAVLADLPGLVGAKDLGRAVLVGDAQLQQQGLAVGRHAVHAGVDKGAHGPAAGNGGYQLVFLGKLIGDVVGGVLQVGLVRGEAGGKQLVSHLLAVEVQLKDAHRGGVDAGTCHGARQIDLLAKDHGHGRGALLGKAKRRVADPLGVKRGAEKTGLEGEVGLGRLAGVVGHNKVGGINGARCQRRAVVASSLRGTQVYLVLVYRNGGGGHGGTRAVAGHGKVKAGMTLVGHAAGLKALDRES